MEFFFVENPLDIDFNIEVYHADFVEGNTIKDYFPDSGKLAVLVNNKEVPEDYIIKQDDAVIFTPYLEGKKGLFAALMVIFIVAVSVMTYGAATAPAAGAAGATEGAADVMTSAYLTADLGASAVASTTSGLGSSFVANLAIGAGLMAINTLLAPKVPDSNDMPPARSVYLWGDNKTKNEQMTPIPVLLGTFSLPGNLVAYRSTSRNSLKYDEPLYETGFFDFILSANKLSSIDNIYLNKLPIEDMSDDDLSCYYTKGTDTQSFIYAFDDSLTSNDEVYRYANLDNDPMVENEALIPGVISETVLNKKLERPEHIQQQNVIDSYNSVDSIEVLPDLVEFYGKCDNTGTLLPDPNINPEDDSGYIKLKFRKSEVAYNEAALDNDQYLEWPEGEYLDTIPTEFHDIYVKFDGKEPKQILQVVYLSTVNTNEQIFEIKYSSKYERVVEPLSQVKIAKKVDHTPLTTPADTVDECRLDYTVDHWTTHLTTLEDIEGFEIELFFNQGLIYLYQGESKVHKLQCFVSFAWEIKEIDTGRITYLDSKTTPVYSSGSLRPEYQPVLGVLKQTNQPFISTVTHADILNHPLAYGSDKIILTDNKLNGGIYEIKLRLYSRGVGGGKTYRYNPDKGYNEWCALEFFKPRDKETIANDCYFYRIKEYIYSGSLTYPKTSNLGLVLNTSDALSGSRPQIQVIGKGEIRTDYTDINASTEFSNNPGLICLDLLFNPFYGLGLGGYESNPTKLEEFKQLVDVDSFLEFAAYCDEPVDIPNLDAADNVESVYDTEQGKWRSKRYTCNAVIDTSGSIIDWLNKLLGTYSAHITLKGSKLSVVYEKEIEQGAFLPEQIFTTSNILKDSFEQSFLNPNMLASTVETTFMDEDNYYTKTPVIFAPFDGTNADFNKKTTVNFFGVTNKYRLYDLLGKVIRKNNFLTSVYKFSTHTSGLTIRPGSQIGINHEFIEWGTVQGKDLKTTGRILEANSTTKKIYIDKQLYQEDQEVDLTGYYLYLQSLGDDTKSQIVSIAAYEIKDTYSILTVNESFTGFTRDDLYIIGSTVELYKEVIVTDVAFQTNNIVQITAVEYNEDVFSKLTLITDLFGSNFIKADCIVRNLEARYENELIELYWQQPRILDPDYKTNFSISLVKYAIYRKEIHLLDATTAQTKWINIAETTDLYYDDSRFDPAINYEYKVIPVFNINGHEVWVPRSWCPTVIPSDVYNNADYIVKPVIFDVKHTESSLGEGYVDTTIFVEHFAKLAENKINYIIVWKRESDSSSTDWLGPMNITLAQDVEAYANCFYVSDYNGLPNKGLLVINDEEMVFAERDTNNPQKYNLIYYGQDSISRRFSLGISQKAGVSVKNAHRGFYPVTYFATQEDNNTQNSKDDDYIIFDSLYYYDLNTENAVLVTPSDSEHVDNLKSIGLNPELWRITSGYVDRVTYPLGGGVADGQFFIKAPLHDHHVQDFILSYASITCDKEAHSLEVVALAKNLLVPEYVPIVKPYGAKGTYFTLQGIPTDKYVWVALTHAEIVSVPDGYDYGYTSYPVMVED